MKEFSSFVEKDTYWRSVLEEENAFRKLFAQEISSSKLADKFLGLISPHSDDSLQRASKIWPEEEKISTVMPLKTRLKEGDRAIASKQEFLANFRLFTEGMFNDMDWSNAFCAGGSMLACLQPVPDPHNTTQFARRKYLRDTFPGSDVDIFIWGLDEEGAKRKMNEIFECVSNNVPYQCVAFRTPSAVTIVSQFPYRHVQIVLRLYKSPAEILMGFDVDSCCIGFDGKDVWMTKRAHMALTSQVNTIDLTRRSPSYEMRLAKYSERGFEIRVPGLDRTMIDPQIYERGFDKVNGLARLLLLESLKTQGLRMNFKEHQRARKLRPAHEMAGRYAEYNYARDGDLRASAVDSHDYQTVFLPYGERWTAERIRQLADKKDRILNNPFLMHSIRKTRHHQHPCFFGTMSDVFEDCCKQCPSLPDDWDPEEAKLFVKGEISFIVDDPGRQEIGSFNPITEGDWTEGTYIDSKMTDIIRAITKDDAEMLKTFIIEKKEGEETCGVDPNQRDWLGRSPLILATFCNAINCVRYLLSSGIDAKICAALPDGRTALHIAAEYGLVEIGELILERNEYNIKAAADKKKQPKNALKKAKEELDAEEDGYESVTQDELSDEDDYHSVSGKDLAGTQVEEEEDDDILELDKQEWDLKMSPLHFACLYGQPGMIKLLLYSGASKIMSWKPDKQKLSYTYFQLSMLCPSIEGGLKAIEALIDGNVSLALVDLGLDTIFHTAVLLNRIDVLELLGKKCGSEALVCIDHVNEKIMSPLESACNLGRTEALKVLLDSGAKLLVTEEVLTQLYKISNTNRYDSVENVIKKHSTPFQICCAKGNYECLKILLDFAKANPVKIDRESIERIDQETMRVNVNYMTHIFRETTGISLDDYANITLPLKYQDTIVDICAKRKLVTLSGLVLHQWTQSCIRSGEIVKELHRDFPEVILPEKYTEGVQLSNKQTTKAKSVGPNEWWYEHKVKKDEDSWERYVFERLCKAESAAYSLGGSKQTGKAEATLDFQQAIEILTFGPNDLTDFEYCNSNLAKVVGPPREWNYSNGTFGRLLQLYYAALNPLEDFTRGYRYGYFQADKKSKMSLVKELRDTAIMIERYESCEKILLEHGIYPSDLEVKREMRSIYQSEEKPKNFFSQLTIQLPYTIEKQLKFFYSVTKHKLAQERLITNPVVIPPNNILENYWSQDRLTSAITVMITEFQNLFEKEKKQQESLPPRDEQTNATDKPKQEIENPLYTMYSEIKPRYGSSGKKVESEQLKLWHELFESVWKNDLKRVKKLTILGDPKDIVVVYVKGPLGFTLLHLAVIRENSTMLKELLKIAMYQHQPVEMENTKEKPSTKTFNNYELFEEDYDEDDEEQFVSESEEEEWDPNAENSKVSFLLRRTSPMTVFDLLNQTASFKLGELFSYEKCDVWVQTTSTASDTDPTEHSITLGAVQLAATKSDEIAVELLRNMFKVLQEGDYILCHDTYHKTKEPVKKFVNWRMIPDLLHGKNIVCSEATCSDVHYNSPIYWALFCESRELLKFAVEEGLCGRDLDTYFELAKGGVKAEDDDLPAGATMSNGSTKPYLGQRAKSRIEREAAVDDNEDDFSVGENDYSMMHYASILQSTVLFPLLLNKDNILKTAILTFGNLHPDHPWSSKILNDAGVVEALMNEMFGGNILKWYRGRTLEEKFAKKSDFVNKLRPTPTPIHVAAYRDKARSIDTMVKLLDTKRSQDWCIHGNENGEMAIHCAAALGHLDSVKSLVAYDENQIQLVDRIRNWTAIHFAAYHGRVQTLAYLLSQVCANGKFSKLLLQTSKQYGHTPLMLAVMQGRQKCVKLLLVAERFLKTSSTDKSDSMGILQPLHMAIRTQHFETVKQLLAASDGSAATDKENENEIQEMLGVKVSKLEPMKVDITREDVFGLTPLATASQIYRSELKNGHYENLVCIAGISDHPIEAKKTKEHEEDQPRKDIAMIYRILGEKCKNAEGCGGIGLEGDKIRAVHSGEIAREFLVFEKVPEATAKFVDLVVQREQMGNVERKIFGDDVQAEGSVKISYPRKW